MGNLDYFHEAYGFMDKKEIAINLLKKTISILNEFKINYFLISGTLLGYVRHNNFIPWDDDIDILVDYKILSNIKDIVNKYPEVNLFFKNKNDSIKICFSDGDRIKENEDVLEWEETSIREGGKYCWPFVDMFVYQETGAHICERQEKNGLSDYKCFRFIESNKIYFFHRRWKKEHFLPIKQVSFLGIEVNIPNNPQYFLNRNYGPNYMTDITSSSRAHKIESSIVGTITIKYDELKG